MSDAVVNFLLAFAVPGGLVAPVAMVVGYRYVARWSDTTKLAIILWCLMLGICLPVAASFASFDPATEFDMSDSAVQSSLSRWASRVSSLVLIAFSLTILARFWLTRGRDSAEPVSRLAKGFCTYLLGTALIGMTAAGEPMFSYKVFYVPIVLGAAYTLGDFRERVIAAHVKAILFLVAAVSLLLAAVAPQHALLGDYQGLIPGVHFRLYGLSTHPNTLGPAALLLIVFELYFPSPRLARYTLLACGALVFILAQSKTAWVAAVGLYVFGLIPYRIVQTPGLNAKVVFLTANVIAAVTVLLIVTALYPTEGLSNTESLTTLTGRTEIWRITLEEFKHYPVFGYGPQLWGLEYRLQEGWLVAGQAHNQFIQTLGESGSVGLLLLLGYLAVLFGYAIRYLRESRGLVLVLLILICFRCFSESPLRVSVLLEWAFVEHLLLVVFAARATRNPGADTNGSKPSASDTAGPWIGRRSAIPLSS
jgi:O-antigen ligase